MELNLTTVHLEILMLLANGYRTAEIAEKTHWSEGVVKKKIAQARVQVGARTVPQLVSIAIAEGLLVWDQDDRERYTSNGKEHE